MSCIVPDVTGRLQSAEQWSSSARAPLALGEASSSCRSLLLEASILLHYWPSCLLHVLGEELLAVGWASTAGCAWNELSNSSSASLMLCSLLTTSCSSATCCRTLSQAHLLQTKVQALPAASPFNISLGASATARVDGALKCYCTWIILSSQSNTLI